MEAPTADPMVHAEKEAERAENELVEVDTPDVVQEANGCRSTRQLFRSKGPKDL